MKMDIREFRRSLTEIERDHERDIATDAVVERFVLKHLPELDMEGSTPVDILSPRTIEILFRNGALHLNDMSMGKGGVFTISDGQYIDVSADGEFYLRLFDKWEKQGWVHMDRDQAGEITAIRLSKTVEFKIAATDMVFARPAMNWKQNLERLFSASVNQGTLEDAADLIAHVSARDVSYHAECMHALEQGIRAADAGDSVVVDIINTSRYRVDSASEAGEMLREFLQIYLAAYGARS
jgi:hypothetical protein